MVTSKDLRECYVALLKLQEACGCEGLISNDHCWDEDCAFNSCNDRPIQKLKEAILNIEIGWYRNELIGNLGGPKNADSHRR